MMSLVKGNHGNSSREALETRLRGFGREVENSRKCHVFQEEEIAELRYILTDEAII